MIERYTRPEMGSIWTLENRYKSWLDVEIAVCKAWAEKGRIPEEALQNIIDKAEIDADRILAIEEITRHDIIASKAADFQIGERTFEIGGKGKGQRQIASLPAAYVVKDDIETGYANVIPLWHFGMMY